MAFRMTFEDLDVREEAQDLWRGSAPRFRVWSGDEPLRVVRVELSALLAEQLLSEPGATQDATAGILMESRLLEVLLRFAVRQIDQQRRAGVLPATPSVEVHVLRVEEGDLPLLASMLGAKTCDYQLRDWRDLLCSAATPNDQTQVGLLGRRTVAPKSTVACLACCLTPTTCARGCCIPRSSGPERWVAHFLLARWANAPATSAAKKCGSLTSVAQGGTGAGRGSWSRNLRR
jgi:hypothetical protein